MSPKRRWWPAGLALTVLAACGGPTGLDADEAEMSARTCTGLLVRAVEAADRKERPTRIDVDDIRAVEPARFSGDDPLADHTSSATALVVRCRGTSTDDGG